jgi:outer membrane protein
MDAYRRALTHDPALQAARYQRAARIEVQPQALASLLPQVVAAGTAQRQIERGLISDNSTRAQTAYGTNRGYGLALSQPVFDLQSFNRWRESRLLSAQAEATLQAAQQRLLLRVASAYFDVLSSADQLAAYRSQREAFAKRLDQARVLEQTGIKARTDVEDAQAFYDRTAQNVIDAENALEDAKRSLATTTGEFPESFTVIQMEIPLEKPSPDNADAWAEAAGRDNFELQAAALATQAAERDVEVQRSRYWPTLAVEAAAGRTMRNDVFGGDLDDGSVALTFSWPLYEGGATRSRVHEAQATTKQTAAEYENLRRQIERATRAAFRGVATGVDRVNAAKRSADSSARAVEASRRGVEFGTRTELDALNTQTNYFTALRAYQQSRYDYLRAVLTLKQLAGRLTEADLVEIDRLLAPADANTGNSHAS